MAYYGILIMILYEIRNMVRNDMGSSIWYGMIWDPDYGMIWDPHYDMVWDPHNGTVWDPHYGMIWDP